MSENTETKQVTSEQYVAISIGPKGSFKNLDVTNVVMLEADSQPDVRTLGDPMVPHTLYHYELEDDDLVWAKAISGTASIKVTTL